MKKSYLGFALLFLSACAAQKPRPAPVNPPSVAPAEGQADANLTQSEAEARRALVGTVAYTLHVDLDEKSERFHADAQVDFTLKKAEATFLDFQDGAEIESLVINGAAVSHPEYRHHRIVLPAGLLRSDTTNHIRMRYTQAYSHHGRGLHRFEDPEDHKVYLHTQFESYDAHHLFPCFDQPDLKATMKLDVSAPAEWQVISTTRESAKKAEGAFTHWTFPVTPKLSTYLFSLHAGPFRVWTSRAGNIPLRLFARQSLAKYIQVDDWFKPTQQGLKFYGNYFGRAYPFKKYDQVIAPGFNSGAMENAGAVTFAEFFVQRSTPTRADRELLASVILHEMAHMWFGDLVTMQWWNGLWLNESFATFMSALALDQATEFKEAWHSFYQMEKNWAYYEDQLVTTHPIDGEVPDLLVARVNFDGITYGKGSAVLKQLRFFLGDAAFREGVRYYFRRHAFGNTTLQDFMGALEHSSKKNLTAWAQTWLREAGVDSVRPVYSCAGGKIANFHLELRGPDGRSSPRPHRTVVALYQRQGAQLRVKKTADVSYQGDSTPVAAFAAQPCPDFVDVNDQDQDYAKALLDDRSLATAREVLASLPSSLTRARVWGSLFQMVRDAELAPPAYLTTVLLNFPRETDLNTAKDVADKFPRALYYLPRGAEVDSWAGKLEILLWERLSAAPAGSDWQKEMLDKFGLVSRTPYARGRLAGLLAGTESLPGFTLDPDRRWDMIINLSSLGDERAKPFLTQAKKEDPSERGVENAMAAEAAWPSLAVKQEWIAKVSEPEFPFARARRALSFSFLPSWQDDIHRALFGEFYEQLPRLVETRKGEFLGLYSRALSPTTCQPGDSAQLGVFLAAHPEFPPVVKKVLRVSAQENDRCVKIRAKGNY